jgi:hypothetical protein
MTGNFTAKCAKMKVQRAQSIGALCGYPAFLAVKNKKRQFEIHPPLLSFLCKKTFFIRTRLGN